MGTKALEAKNFHISSYKSETLSPIRIRINPNMKKVSMKAKKSPLKTLVNIVDFPVSLIIASIGRRDAVINSENPNSRRIVELILSCFLMNVSKDDFWDGLFERRGELLRDFDFDLRLFDFRFLELSWDSFRRSEEERFGGGGGGV
jgi:hypothetical protein